MALIDRRLARAIIHLVAEQGGYSPAEIAENTGSRAQRSLEQARQLAMAAVREGTEMSWSEIGTLFGDRHIDTVRHHYWAVDLSDERKAARDAVIRQAMERIGA